MRRRTLSMTCAVIVAALVPASAQAAVDAYPAPGSTNASTSSQLSFRGVSAGKLGAVTVTGSQSGRHTGRLLRHSDGRGVSFVPAKPFAANERVVVRTGRSIRGARRGDYSLRTQIPGPGLRPPPLDRPPFSRDKVQRFHTRKDLVPTRVNMRGSKGAAKGNLFVAPKFGVGDPGPMIVDQRGDLVWFKRLQPGYEADDFRTQRYRGKPVLTWWEGYGNLGVGYGEGVMLDRRYREIARIRAGNGYYMDPHELEITKRNTALIGILAPVVKDLSKVGGSKRGVVLDSVVQEIDIRTGAVLFEWHSLDDVKPAESYQRPNGKRPFDYFHINAIAETRAGDLLVSGRNTWSVVKVGKPSARLRWRLGGRKSSFKMGKGTGFAWQHAVRQRPNGVITLFDNGSMPPVHKQSQAIGIRLRKGRATQVRRYRRKPSVLAGSQGNMQVLPNGNVLVGWGAIPLVTEFSGGGRRVQELSFPKQAVPKAKQDPTKPKQTQTYRAFKQSWAGNPLGRPAVVASHEGKVTNVFASWNGATHYRAWRVLAGPSPDRLKAIKRVRRSGFETGVKVPGQPAFVAVQALGKKNGVLRSSTPVAPR